MRTLDPSTLQIGHGPDAYAATVRELLLGEAPAQAMPPKERAGIPVPMDRRH
jgi:hypothetical protein